MGEQQRNPLESLDVSEQVVAMWTGVKAQFVAAGWSPLNAERMTIEIFKLNAQAVLSGGVVP